MAIPFKYRRGLWMVAIWAMTHVAAYSLAYGDLIGDLCDAHTGPAEVLESLVEEAEATGMPPATLNRLLVVGYRDSESVADLRQLLCTIVIAEENGLPPDPLFKKLEEGLGKRVSLIRIQNAITRQTEKLQYAQTLLAGNNEPAIDDVNVERIADLLDIGISHEDLAHLFSPSFSSPTTMRIVAAEILGYGTIAGFPRMDLDQVVSTGLTFQSLSPEWSYFIKVIKAARKQSISDKKTADAAVKILSEKKSINDLIEYLGLDSTHVYDGRHQSKDARPSILSSFG